ncbi:AAA family ATPase [Curtobacterium sp. VKM Ac-2922]|uniref:AAA family ATPase n=1 Tax=Curtobacterium sp. VKM Ac-2922 TaxID=2929475 RepID=UPI001FB4D819|nr:SMC family ATPase [Curtobacterium sp. VKM Ac-2922]MCJ1715705.1 SMC family ATPase [Curtobacterium sp. VKM Ac-2922]
MYLHRLDLRAIGPYPDRVTIDFAALAASGVFLLEGPTGSGKSTIIDAVVFALYGGLAGSDASSDRLHSQHADPAVEPYVELVFETGAGVFRVRRTPQYERPKQRGTGTVRQNASATLSRLTSPTDPVGDAVSARAQEIGAEVARIVGLDRAQFLQTVVLPQGEFARFLRAPGEDRRKLLQSLFGTEIYDRTADELATRRRAAAAEVDAADARVRDALARFAEASGTPDADESSAPTLAAQLRAQADAADAARVTAAAAARAATDHEQAVVARVAALDRRRGFLRRSAALDQASAAVDAARVRLASGERAARVAAVADGLDAALSRAARAHHDRDALRARHGVTDLDAAAERDRLARVASDVRHLVPVAESLPGRVRALEAARTDAESLEAQLSDLDQALQDRPDERARIVAASHDAAIVAADAQAAQHDADAVQVLRAAHTALDAVRSRVTSAQAAVAAARTSATAAVQAEQYLRERRIAGLAGELGAALAPGDACPVCGSVDHPAVATPQDDHPTPSQIQAAVDTARRAEQSLAEAATDLALERAERDRLTAVVGDADPETLDHRAAAAAERLRVAHDAATSVAEHERAKTAHDEATRALERDRNAVATRRQVLQATTEADHARLQQDTRAVQAAQRTLAAERTVVVAASIDPTPDDTTPDDTTPDDPTSHESDDTTLSDDPTPDDPTSHEPEDTTLSDAVAALDDRVAAFRAVADADEHCRTADAAVTERQAEVAQVVADHEFADVTAARAAVLDPADAARLRAEVDHADRERAVVDAGLAEPAVVAAAQDDTDDVPLDLERARVVTAQAAAALDQAIRTAATTGDRAVAAERCSADLARALTQRASTSARSRAVVRLADIAAGAPGHNTTGVTLGTYVLMRRFEDVVAAANDRLRTMLGGRFTLETSDERETGTRSRRTGLALAVRDHTTDTTRDPRSLSGGETFTVSLCLALGLADVVQAEAGGVSLGTLFVDEGFGTLDPETLDGVVDQLARLTAGGRQVGIVSHVEELKQRIPERIAVRRSPGGGSHVTTTV